jgi:hypothetical protein
LSFFKGSDVAVAHRIVLFLGNLKKDPRQATWQELHDSLLNKHPDLTKKKLRQIVNSSKNLFSVVNGQVNLLELDSNFVKSYFELAEGVEVIEQMNNSLCLNSCAEPFRISFGNSIRVTGLLCVVMVSAKGKAAVFQFGGHTAYRLGNSLPSDNIGDHMHARATLRIRKISTLLNIVSVKFAKGCL